MAYRCILWLKNECDGCGACEEDIPFFPRRGREDMDGPYDPFYDPMDEEELDWKNRCIPYHFP